MDQIFQLYAVLNDAILISEVICIWKDAVVVDSITWYTWRYKALKTEELDCCFFICWSLHFMCFWFPVAFRKALSILNFSNVLKMLCCLFCGFGPNHWMFLFNFTLKDFGFRLYPHVLPRTFFFRTPLLMLNPTPFYS